MGYMTGQFMCCSHAGLPAQRWAGIDGCLHLARRIQPARIDHAFVENAIEKRHLVFAELEERREITAALRSCRLDPGFLSAEGLEIPAGQAISLAARSAPAQQIISGEICRQSTFRAEAPIIKVVNLISAQSRPGMAMMRCVSNRSRAVRRVIRATSLPATISCRSGGSVSSGVRRTNAFHRSMASMSAAKSCDNAGGTVSGSSVSRRSNVA